MPRRLKISLQLFPVMCALIVIGTLLPASVSAAKVNLSPSVVSITEGQQQVVNITLDEPIICEVTDESCTVEIDVSVNGSTRVTTADTP